MGRLSAGKGAIVKCEEGCSRIVNSFHTAQLLQPRQAVHPITVQLYKGRNRPDCFPEYVSQRHADSAAYS